MSKIGRKPIPVSSSVKVEVNGKSVAIAGPKAKFVHELPEQIDAKFENGLLSVSIKENTRANRVIWGLHRALLANKIKGADTGFEKKIKIVGLGYKALLSGKKLNFSLGYSHKIEYTLPDGIDITVDKTGQNLVLKSSDKLLLGNTCDAIRSLRPPEPYKGTGIILEGEVVIRKAGKTKAAA